MATEKQKSRIVDALMALAAEKDFLSIGLVEIAEKAEVDLAELRKAYDGRMAILADFARRIDAAVIAGDDPAMKTEPTRERLFDVLMRRFDQLNPYRAGIKGLLHSARRDPLFGVEVNRIAVLSQRWMLTAAGVDQGGLKGYARAQALAIAYARVLEVFLEEEDPALPKTMAALDKALKRLEGLAEKAGKVEARAEAFCASLNKVFGDFRRACKPDKEPSAEAPKPEGGEATATGAV